MEIGHIVGVNKMVFDLGIVIGAKPLQLKHLRVFDLTILPAPGKWCGVGVDSKGRNTDMKTLSDDVKTLAEQVGELEKQRNRLRTLAGEIIATIRVNALRGTFGEHEDKLLELADMWKSQMDG